MRYVLYCDDDISEMASGARWRGTTNSFVEFLC